MLIIALVLAVIGLAALVTAVVTSNELIAWVCIAASVVGVLLLIIDAIRERQRGEVAVADADAIDSDAGTAENTYQTFDADYPEAADDAEVTAVDAPDAPDVPDLPDTDAGTDDEVGEVAEDVAVADSEVALDTDATVHETASEVHYVSADESDSAMEVNYVGDTETATVDGAEGTDAEKDR